MGDVRISTADVVAVTRAWRSGAFRGCLAARRTKPRQHAPHRCRSSGCKSNYPRGSGVLPRGATNFRPAAYMLVICKLGLPMPPTAPYRGRVRLHGCSPWTCLPVDIGACGLVRRLAYRVTVWPSILQVQREVSWVAASCHHPTPYVLGVGENLFAVRPPFLLQTLGSVSCPDHACLDF